MSQSSHHKIFIFSAPSGSGKTTIVNSILSEGKYPLEFSVSATSRSPRGSEKNGVEYYFLSPDEFRKKIDEDLFLEWEQVYTDTYYGTLRSELDRIWNKGNAVILDVDQTLIPRRDLPYICHATQRGRIASSSGRSWHRLSR